MNNHLRPLSLTALISLSYGCGLMTTTKSSVDPVISAESIISAINDNKQKIVSFSGEARIAIDTGEMMQTGTCYIRIEMPSTLEMSIRGPLGIPIAEVKADSGYYMLRDYLRQDFYEGTPDEIDFMGLPFSSGLNELLEVLTGTTTINPKELDSLRQYSIDGDKYYFEIRINDVKKSSWVDRKSLILVRQIISVSNGEYELEKRFYDIETINGVNLPRIIHVFSEKLGGSFSLEYTNRTIEVLEEVIP